VEIDGEKQSGVVKSIQMGGVDNVERVTTQVSESA